MAHKLFQRILVVQKRTKYELDIEAYGSLSEYRKISREKDEVFQRTFESHERQLSSRAFLKERVFPDAEYIFRENLEIVLAKSNFDLVISHGGDNHFTYVAHKMGGTTILGCNSDPNSSVGALLPFTAESLLDAKNQNYDSLLVEHWTQISTNIHYPDGTKVETVPAICEISVRNNSPDLTSRYWIQHEKESEEQKCSGLLLYTGAGSTGWIASCSPKKFQPFPKNKSHFQVYARELRTAKNRQEFSLADFRTQKEVEVVSEMNGGIAIDSLTERHYAFPPFSKAIFRIADSTLAVVVPKKEK